MPVQPHALLYRLYTACRVGQNHTSERIHGVNIAYTSGVVGSYEYIWSYTVCIYSCGQT